MSSERKPVKIVCSYCGSDDVLIDAYAQWNVEKQEMEVAQTFDKGHYCNQCDGECSIDEVEIEHLTLLEGVNDEGSLCPDNDQDNHEDGGRH